MKHVLALLLAALLVGCASKPTVVVKTEYIVRTAPAAQKELPPYPAKIDLTNATQVTLAEWIKANEQYVLDVESIIANLVKFYEAPVAPKEPAK